MILRKIKSAYRTVIPFFIRQSALAARLKGFIYENLLGHDALYDSHYYDFSVEEPAVRSAKVIAELILLDLKPMSVVDVGCGTGALLEALQKKGCQVFGLEYSKAALEYCHARKLNVVKFNLEKDVFKIDHTFDLAVSLEVAEHLPEEVADNFVNLLTRLSSTVVFTAAPPGQGGLDHVNEQLPSYWISKYQDHGFEHDKKLSKRWHDRWKATGIVPVWYYQNLMIFQRIKGI